MKRIIIGITIFLMFSFCFSLFAYADIHEEKNVIVKPYDIESEWLLLTIKGREVQFNITSNLPVHAYLMTSDAYFDMNWFPYDEEDFSVNVFEKKNVENIYFTWTQPDDQSYYLVIFNPNEENATISYSYTETLLEELGEFFTDLTEICTGTFCFIVVVFDLIISLIIAIWIYKDAKEREKNSTAWAIIGFVFNIIGLIIWLLVRPSIKEVTKLKTSDRRCPHCGRIIPIDARVCPYCSKQFW